MARRGIKDHGQNQHDPLEIEQMEQQRFKKVALQKKEKLVRKLEKYQKCYKSMDEVPLDWSFKLGLEISIPLLAQPSSQKAQ